jgi:surfactin synthase thioesterase subunit
MRKVKLFCLPYAGSSSSIFYKWMKYVNEFIEIVPIDYRGHGIRSKEPLCEDMEEMVNDIYDLIYDEIHDGEYAIFGHSIGTVITYELVNKIMIHNEPMPIHIFLSGRLSPEHKCESVRIHDAAPEILESEIMKLGGTPKEVFENSELASLFIPILRSDCKILDEYNFRRYEKFPVNLSIFYSLNDIKTKGNLYDWKEYSNGNTDFYQFEGNHFFIDQSTEDVVHKVNLIIQEELIKQKL